MLCPPSSDAKWGSPFDSLNEEFETLFTPTPAPSSTTKDIDITEEYEIKIKQLHDENFALQRKAEELKRNAWLKEQKAVRDKKQLSKRIKELEAELAEKSEAMEANEKDLGELSALREKVGAIREEVTCFACEEIIQEPIVLDCGHSGCRQCMTAHFKADGYACGACDNKTRRRLISNTQLASVAKLFID